jgi:glycosyltransferase involved in cell wall biosynthesis
MMNLHSNSSLLSGHFLINGVNVFYSKSVWRYKTLIVTPRMLSLLSRNLGNYDIIHIHDCRSFQGIITYLLAKMKKIPYVFQPHGSYLSLLPEMSSKVAAKIALDKLVGNKIVRNASRIIALSQAEAEQYIHIGVQPKKIAIIPNGLDLADFVNLPPQGSFKKKIGLNEKEQIVLYLGRLHESKGLQLLAEAFSIVSRELGDVKLVVIGPDDGYLKAFTNLVFNLGINNKVILMGYADKQTKMAALADGCVFVTPFFSGFPMTFLEACAAGAPIVTTNFGDSLKWIDHHVGYVVPPTASDLAKAICRLLSDNGLREEYSKNCKKLVKSEFSLEMVANKLERIYAEVIANVSD